MDDVREGGTAARRAAAEKLGEALVLRRRMENLAEKRREVLLTSLHGIDYSSGGGRSSDTTSRTERTALKLEKIDRQISELWTQWAAADDFNVTVIGKVMQLDSCAALMLSYFYLSGYTAGHVAELEGRDVRQIQRLKAPALELAYEAMTAQKPPDTDGA